MIIKTIDLDHVKKQNNKNKFITGYINNISIKCYYKNTEKWTI